MSIGDLSVVSMSESKFTYLPGKTEKHRNNVSLRHPGTSGDFYHFLPAAFFAWLSELLLDCFCVAFLLRTWVICRP
jgi:hypothetical protein